MPSVCSAVAVPISPTSTLTCWAWPTISPMVCWAWPTSAAPLRTVSTLLPIKVLISRAALALRWARLRTSEATTAKPRPCSPARAASTAALSARILVWKAMPSITPMMSEILPELALISPIVATTWPTKSPPVVATWLDWPASEVA